MRRVLFVLSVVLAASFPAFADVIHLKGGGEFEGEVVEERAEVVVVEVSAGRITIPRSRIERMVLGASALARFRARAAQLAGGDVRGWLALAAWARDNDLLTQARAAYEHVLALDPGNAAAHAALGHVPVDGRWLTLEQSYRARGLVEFEGTWVSPQERQVMLAERAAEAARRLQEVEAEARIREAEARARAAEAEARLAEAQQQQPIESGIPYPWIFGGGYGAVPVAIGPVEPPPPPPTVIVVTPRDRGDRHRDRDKDRRETRPARSSSRAVRKDGSPRPPTHRR